MTLCVVAEKDMLDPVSHNEVMESGVLVGEVAGGSRVGDPVFIGGSGKCEVLVTRVLSGDQCAFALGAAFVAMIGTALAALRGWLVSAVLLW